MKRQIFSAELDSLYSMLACVRNAALHYRVDESLLDNIELACEEALVNIIQHAYPDKKGSIHIQCSASPTNFKIVIIDEGIPFNPLSDVAPKQIDRTPETEGGYGVYFIKQLMDEVDYKREGNSNVLTLWKRMTRKTL